MCHQNYIGAPLSILSVRGCFTLCAAIPSQVQWKIISLTFVRSCCSICCCNSVVRSDFFYFIVGLRCLNYTYLWALELNVSCKVEYRIFYIKKITWNAGLERELTLLHPDHTRAPHITSQLSLASRFRSALSSQKPSALPLYVVRVCKDSDKNKWKTSQGKKNRLMCSEEEENIVDAVSHSTALECQELTP